jgi:hypothetical protein
MSIKREDIDRSNVDFSDVRSGRRLPPVHPGEILRDEFLMPMGVSVTPWRMRSRCRARGQTTSCAAAAPSPRTPRFVLASISARPLSSGSTCRAAMISMLPIAP